jgi:hypothetical protein
MMPLPMLNRTHAGARVLLLALVSAACQPTVRVEAPDKPIEINLNIRIEQEVRVRIERDLEDVFRDDPEIFGLPAGGM